MKRPARDDELLARADGPLLAPDTEQERSLDDREALFLAGVPV